MDFELTEQQKRAVAAFREFGERTFTHDSVMQWREDQGLPDDVVQEFVHLYFGLMDEADSEAVYSGIQGGLMMQALIIEELSRCSGTTLPFQNDLFYLYIMAGFASDADVSTVVRNYRDTGRVMFALAVSEPQAGSDTMNMETRVETVGGKLRLNGVKTFVNNGEYAPYILVAAIDGDAPDDGKYPPLSFWLVPRSQRGIYAFPISKIGQPMLPFASVRFEDVELQPEWRLTGTKAGFPHLFALLERGRIFTCASSLGMAQAAMEDAVRYASERTAFGTTVADFQLIQQMLTDMELRLQNMRNMLYRAADKIDKEAEDRRLYVALMKRYIPAAATEVASDAMQILGGIGYTVSQRVSAIWEDCRGNQLAEGTDQVMVRIAAPLILDKYLGGDHEEN